MDSPRFVHCFELASSDWPRLSAACKCGLDAVVDVELVDHVVDVAALALDAAQIARPRRRSGSHRRSNS